MGKLIGQTAPESNPKATTGRGAQGPPQYRCDASHPQVTWHNNRVNPEAAMEMGNTIRACF